jgi:hypothetical protein
MSAVEQTGMIACRVEDIDPSLEREVFWANQQVRELEELWRRLPDFLLDQIRIYPEAEAALRYLAIRVRDGDF